MFLVKLANFFMFAFSEDCEETTVECLEGSSASLAMVGPSLRLSSEIFVSL